MDIDGTNSLPNSQENSMGSTKANEEKKSMKRNHSNPLFVNHGFVYPAAELAWHEMRRAWVGVRSQTSHTNCRQPIMSWTSSFEDLLASSEPFPEPISLVDVVDLLADIWIDEYN